MKSTHGNSLKTNRPARVSQTAGRLMVLILAAVAGYAQSTGASPSPQSGKPGESHGQNGTQARVRRLEMVTWNPVTEELTWVVSSGDKSSGAYTPATKATYVIHMDAAVMGFEGEDRRFDANEADQVHALMDMICRYAVESTIWWEQGQGEKLDHEMNPIPGNKEKNKDGDDPGRENKKPALKVLHGPVATVSLPSELLGPAPASR